MAEFRPTEYECQLALMFASTCERCMALTTEGALAVQTIVSLYGTAEWQSEKAFALSHRITQRSAACPTK